MNRRDSGLHSVLVQTVDDPGDYGDPPVALEMRAGKISLHSGWILHGSEPNRSDRRRCGLAMRYLSADVRASSTGTRLHLGAAAPTPAATGPTTPAPAAKNYPRPTTPPTSSESRPSVADAGGWGGKVVAGSAAIRQRPSAGASGYRSTTG